MNTIAVSPAASAARTGAVRSTRPSLLRRVMLAFQVARERRALVEMDDRLLADIGVTPDQAGKEAGRLPWDLPPGRGC